MAHWVWGNSFHQQKTFLSGLGFVDFAGSTVIHSVAGWISLIGIWMLGPRLGRYDAQGNLKPMEAYSLPLAALGVLILWVGWWGFNGGSTMVAGDTSAKVIAMTNVSGVAAGLVAFAHCWFFQRKVDIEAKFLGGILCGLVAITACCHLVTPLAAIAIGSIAAVAHNLTFELLKRVRLDDPVGAVPVHLTGGILGTLFVGLFGRQELLPNPRLTQIGVQLLGIAVCAAWTVTLSYAMFRLLKATVGLRASPQEETEGLNMAGEVTIEAPTLSGLDRDELRKMLE